MKFYIWSVLFELSPKHRRGAKSGNAKKDGKKSLCKHVRKYKESFFICKRSLKKRPMELLGRSFLRLISPSKNALKM
jgi:hypothetical protein